MSPRSLPANFKGQAKATRKAQEQADRDNATMAVMRFGDVVYIRPIVRAEHCVAKHPAESEIVAICEPRT